MKDNKYKENKPKKVNIGCVEGDKNFDVSLDSKIIQTQKSLMEEFGIEVKIIGAPPVQESIQESQESQKYPFENYKEEKQIKKKDYK